MRSFRLLAVTVLLAVCVVLGSACAGAKGEPGPQGVAGPVGPQGEQGIQGPQGEPGPAGAGVIWQGEWSVATTYSLHDAVGYQGSSYVSGQDGNIGHPPTETAWWDLWVEKGDIGEQGLQGVQGIQGEAGATGATGPAGPNMVVAAGNIDFDLTIHQGYNVASVIWYVDRYEITLSGITYNRDRYVALVTPVGARRQAFTSSGNGKLYVYLWNNLGEATQDQFHFVVLDTTIP